MTRIIGGSAGGRRLKTPSGAATRPTADRVREALFSALEARTGSLTGLRFLDLYAGSGAVGLEARSRGAASAMLVEQDRRTAGLIAANARALGLSDVEVAAGAVRRVIEQPPGRPYDVAFLDPPYSLPVQSVVDDLALLGERRWLSEGAVVVVERAARGPAVTWPEGFAVDRARRYGETMLWFGLWYGRATDPAPPAVPVPQES